MERNIYNRTAYTFFIGMAAMLLSSCIKEDLKDCDENSKYSSFAVTLDYSHNMLSANALGSQADQVGIYVFNQQGTLVWQFVSEDGEVTDHDLSMYISDLPNGTYRFAAWARSTRLSGENAFFRTPDLTVGTSRLEELTYFLRRTGGTQQDELNNLLVGITEPISLDEEGPGEVIVNLKKVTNRIRVVALPITGGTQLDVNDYTFLIEDNVGNGHVNYDYSLLKDEPITYLPYFRANRLPDPSEVLTPEEIDRAAVVEINTSRLMEANAPRLKIRANGDGREIVNVNLPWLLSLTKMENHSGWSLQEYLDRQDEYSITLFFTSDSWMQGTIIINGWVVNNVNVDF